MSPTVPIRTSSKWNSLVPSQPKPSPTYPGWSPPMTVSASLIDPVSVPTVSPPTLDLRQVYTVLPAPCTVCHDPALTLTGATPYQTRECVGSAIEAKATPREVPLSLYTCIWSAAMFPIELTLLKGPTAV